MRRILWAFALMAQICSVAEAEEAFRLRDAVDTPAWLTLKGETRVRYETDDEGQKTRVTVKGGKSLD